MSRCTSLWHIQASPWPAPPTHRAAAGEASRRRLQEAEVRREGEAREAAAARYVRKEYKCGPRVGCCPVSSGLAAPRGAGSSILGAVTCICSHHWLGRCTEPWLPVGCKRSMAGCEKQGQRGPPAVVTRTGQLSEEERAARLAAMASNASEHAEQRVGRLRGAAERDTREARRDGKDATVPDAPQAPGEPLQPSSQHVMGLALWQAGSVERRHAQFCDVGAKSAGATPAFLREANREAFGEGTSMADRVGRRKHYNERGGEAPAFRR